MWSCQVDWCFDSKTLMVRRGLRMGVIVAVTLAFGAAMATADARVIDVEHSTLTVHVFKAGLFAAFADNHVIRAPIAEGHVSEVGVLARRRDRSHGRDACGRPDVAD